MRSLVWPDRSRVRAGPPTDGLPGTHFPGQPNRALLETDFRLLIARLEGDVLLANQDAVRKLDEQRRCLSGSGPG